MTLLGRKDLRYILDKVVRSLRQKYRSKEEMTVPIAKLIYDLNILSSKTGGCINDVMEMASAYQNTECFLRRAATLLVGEALDYVNESIESIRDSLTQIEPHIIECLCAGEDPAELLHKLNL